MDYTEGVIWHGWIYIQKTSKKQDSFFVMANGKKRQHVGLGKPGSEKACAYFEETLKLGPVKLFPLGMLGYRVYTEKK